MAYTKRMNMANDEFDDERTWEPRRMTTRQKKILRTTTGILCTPMVWMTANISTTEMLFGILTFNREFIGGFYVHNW